MASYRLPAATGSGYTLLGSPTVIANLNVTGKFGYIAERLLDVNPATNTETLVARGLYRINDNAPDGLQVFQLHPGAWHFAAGHVPKLELLGQDTPYSRPSNGVFAISVADLQLRLPVHESPGSNPAVGQPQPNVTAHPVPCSARPSSSISRSGSRATRTRLVVVGTAAETPCAQASAATQRAERVKHVYVTVSTRAPHRRCLVLKRSGRLSKARSCRRTVQLTASGTTKWHLREAVHLVPGHYLIRVAADRRTQRATAGRRVDHARRG